MGLFGRKSKKKNIVSFGEDVGGDVSSSLPKTNETIEAIQNAPLNNNKNNNNSNSKSKSNSATSSSSSSRKDHIGRSGKDEGKQVISSSVSLCSDIESDHQRKSNNNEGEEEEDDESNGSDYMHDSQDIDFIDDLYKMTADLNEENFDSTAPKAASNVNEVAQNQNINNTSSDSNKNAVSMTVIQSTPDLEEDEINQSGRIDDHDRGRYPTPGANNVMPPNTETNDNISNSNSNSNSTTTKKAEGNLSPRNKSYSNANRSQASSAISTNSESTASAKEQEPNYKQQLLQHEYNSERTRDLVKVFIGEIWNRGEIESIERVCSPRLRFNGHTGLERVGHEGFSRMVTTVRSSLEGYHCEIHSMVVEGRKCFCRLKFTGKHVGELMGYPPTRKLVAWMGASEFTICPRKNQILKVWELGDIKTLEAQLMG